jgi:hypothetical protein
MFDKHGNRRCPLLDKQRLRTRVSRKQLICLNRYSRQWLKHDTVSTDTNIIGRAIAF